MTISTAFTGFRFHPPPFLSISAYINDKHIASQKKVNIEVDVSHVMDRCQLLTKMWASSLDNSPLRFLEGGDELFEDVGTGSEYDPKYETVMNTDERHRILKEAVSAVAKANMSMISVLPYLSNVDPLVQTINSTKFPKRAVKADDIANQLMRKANMNKQEPKSKKKLLNSSKAESDRKEIEEHDDDDDDELELSSNNVPEHVVTLPVCTYTVCFKKCVCGLIY